MSVLGCMEVSCNAVDFVPSTSEDPSTSQENKRPYIFDLVDSDVADPTTQQASKKKKKSIAVKQTRKKHNRFKYTGRNLRVSQRILSMRFMRSVLRSRRTH